MFNTIFNKKIGEIMQLLDVSNNEALKKSVKKKLWDLSDELKANKLIKGDNDNDISRDIQ